MGVLVAGFDEADSESDSEEDEGMGDIEGEFDKVRVLSNKEREDLDEIMLPMKLILVKVRSHGNPGNKYQLLTFIVLY